VGRDLRHPRHGITGRRAVARGLPAEVCALSMLSAPMHSHDRVEIRTRETERPAPIRDGDVVRDETARGD